MICLLADKIDLHRNLILLLWAETSFPVKKMKLQHFKTATLSDMHAELKPQKRF